jgi:hypothetical protein
MSCPPFVTHNSQPYSTWALEWTAERRGRGGELAAPNPTVAGEPAMGMLIFSRQNPETDARWATERNIRLASPRESSCAHSTLMKLIPRKPVARGVLYVISGFREARGEQNGIYRRSRT